MDELKKRGPYQKKAKKSRLQKVTPRRLRFLHHAVLPPVNALLPICISNLNVPIVANFSTSGIGLHGWGHRAHWSGVS